MCGICGFVSEERRYGEKSLRRMLPALAHRGPDGEGTYHPEGVGLGHRRLSIIDLTEAGRQPMPNEDRTIWTVFNGEIYNFRELRSRLERAGHSFRSRTDSEVLVHAYEEWGEAFVRELSGMFAFAVWDEKRRRLLLARDRIGIKPLYYLRTADGVVFASELGSLRAHPAFKFSIDPAALAEYLELGYVAAPRTIYERVEKLLPGHMAVWENKAFRVEKYWEIPDLRSDPAAAGGSEPFRGTFEEALEELKILLDDAVDTHMVSDVPVGAFLSGGVDSSLVVALMRRHSYGPVRTFSIGFREREYDETLYARRAADRLGTVHTEYVLGAGETADLVREAAAGLDEPLGDPSVIPTYLVSRLARRSGVTVALSGDGGDELFCGYERYRKVGGLLRFDSLPPTIRCAAAGAGARLLRGRYEELARTLGYSDYADLYRARMSGWKGENRRTGDRRRSMGGRFGESGRIGARAAAGDVRRFVTGLTCLPDPNASLFYRTAHAARSLDPLDRLMLIDMKTYLPDDVLAKVDRMSMAVSLEVRVPILDTRVVEFARRIPASYKCRDGNLKAILKSLAVRYLPAELFDRPKSGFAIPLDGWLKRDLNKMARGYLDPERIKAEGLLDPKLVSDALAGFEEGRYRNARFLWGLMMFEAWMESAAQSASTPATEAATPPAQPAPAASGV